MRYRKVSAASIMYHVTSTKNAKKIAKEGLKIGQESNFTQEWISDYYEGTVPIFLGKSPWGGETGIVSGAIIKVDVSGMRLVADLPSLADFGAYVDEAEDNVFYWEEGDEESAGPLKPFLEDGTISFERLLTVPSVIKAAIDLTGTAASLEDIPPDRIVGIKYINKKRSANEAERPHDYDPQWDYENPVGMKRNPDYNQEVWKKTTAIRRLAASVMKDIRKRVLPLLPEIETFEVYFVWDELRDGALAEYKNGTRSWPVVMIDAARLIKESERAFAYYSLKDELWLSVVHEIAHALEDIYDLEPDEQQSEDFAEDLLNGRGLPAWVLEARE